jgi:LemA protein
MTGIQLLLLLSIAGSVGVIIWSILVMNRLTAFRLAIREAWMECEITLKRRHELIGLILAAVEDLAPELGDRVQAVASARSQAMVRTDNLANYLSREKVLGSAMNALLEKMETHTALTRSLSLVAQVQELLASESRLGANERAYNARVHEYNGACTTDPTSLIASLGHLKPVPFLDLQLIEGEAAMRATSGPGDTSLLS